LIKSLMKRFKSSSVVANFHGIDFLQLGAKLFYQRFPIDLIVVLHLLGHFLVCSFLRCLLNRFFNTCFLNACFLNACFLNACFLYTLLCCSLFQRGNLLFQRFKLPALYKTHLGYRALNLIFDFDLQRFSTFFEPSVERVSNISCSLVTDLDIVR